MLIVSYWSEGIKFTSPCILTLNAVCNYLYHRGTLLTSLTHSPSLPSSPSVIHSQYANFVHPTHRLALNSPFLSLITLSSFLSFSHTHSPLLSFNSLFTFQSPLSSSPSPSLSFNLISTSSTPYLPFTAHRIRAMPLFHLSLNLTHP